MAQITRDIIQLKKSKTGDVFYPETHMQAVIGLNGNKDAKTVLAGPTSGSAGPASFRPLYPTDITPICSKEYDYKCTANDTNNGHIYFMNVTPTSNDWATPWQVHYLLTVDGDVSDNVNAKYCHGEYDVYIGCAGSNYYYCIYNKFYSSSYYPVYYHKLLYHNTEAKYNSYHISNPAKLGVRIQSAYGPNTVGRHYSIKVYDVLNCTVSFPDNIETYGNVYNTTYYNTVDFNAISTGLQETGDTTNTTDITLYYSRVTAGTNGLMAYSLIMQDGTGNWQSFTTKGITANTKTKNTVGFRLGSRIYYLNQAAIAASTDATANANGVAVKNGNTSNHGVVKVFSPIIDFRYSLNIVSNNSASGGPVGLTRYKPVYIVGTINASDGLFYLDDTWWTQDEPITEDGKIYIKVCESVYSDNGNNPDGQYRGDLVYLGTPYYYKNGKFQEYIVPESANSVPWSGVTGRPSFYDLVIKASDATTLLTYKPTTSGTYQLQLSASQIGLGNVENTKLSTWAGTSNITTLGTISTGTWHGSTIDVGYGGTGKTSWTQYGVLYADTTSSLSQVVNNTTSTRKFLRMVGSSNAATAPAWDTVTKTDVGLSNVENTALSTWAGTQNITTVGTITTGTWNATTISTGKGGTGLTTYTKGDMLYASANNTLAKLGANTGTKKFLSMASSVPSWEVLATTDLPAMYIGKTAVKFENTTEQALTGISTGAFSSSITVGNGSAPASNEQASTTQKRRIYFGSSNYYIEVDKNGYLHTNVGFYSDSFVSAGGLSNAGGSSGIDADALWELLAASTSEQINSSHLPKGSAADLNSGTSTTGVTWGAKTIADYVTSQINTTVSSALYFRGQSSTAITNGGTETATINGQALTAQTGDLVLYDGKEFAWDGSHWIQFGDESSWASKNISISTSGYLTGGGDLTTSRTISINTNKISDSSAASSLSSTSTNLVTERDIYYGLPTINNSHAYTSGTTIYAPTSAGTANQVLLSGGANTAPTWGNASGLSVGTASKLGNSTVGSTTKPIYLSSGTATECNTYAGGTAVTLNGTSKAANTASFYAPTSSGTSGHVLISGGANTAPSFRALVANDIPSLAISKITNLQSSLNAKLTKSGDTMTGQLTIGSTIPVRTTDVDVAPMYGNALYMRGTTGYIEGLKVNSAEGDYFYCADRRSEYTVTSNYKSGSPTVGEYGGSDCAYLFDLVSANRFMLYCPNLETTPWVLTIVKNSGQITATDVLDLWFFQTSNVGYLNSYKIEVLTQITGTSTYEWFTVVDRNNVNDRMHQAAFPIWLVDDTHGTANHSYGNCAGIRITIRKADPTGTWSENYLPICAIQLRDRRPSHKPSAGIGAMDMRGGTFYGDVTFDYGSLTTHDVKPGANNTYSLGTTAARWQNIYGVNADFSGTGTISGNTTVGGTLGVTGNTTLSGTLTVGTASANKATTLNGTLSASGNTTVGGTLTVGTSSVNKATTLNGTLGVTGATTLSSTLAVAGLATLSGGISLGTQYTPSGASSAVDSKLVWDDTHEAWHLIGNFYADGFISAGGLSNSSGGGGVDIDAVWASLTNSVTDEYASTRIAQSHLPAISSSGSGVVSAIAYSGSGNSLVLSVTKTAVVTSLGNKTGTITLSGGLSIDSNNVLSSTDNKVTQTATTTSAAYELLFSSTADNTTRTEGARKTSTLTYNPSTKVLSTGGAVNGLTLSAQTTGFKISGGTTSKTLTVGADYTLGAACAKAVVTEIDTSASLPTSNAVKTFVEGKGYTTNTGTVKSVTLTSGTGITVSDSGTAITSTGSRTISLNVAGAKTALGLGTMAYETASNYLTTTTAASTYVKLSPGASEQTISSSISSLAKGVINLWRSSGDHYTFLGFSNGTTETYLGGIGFKSQSDHNLYHKDGSSYYTIFDENNYTSYVNTTNFPGLNKTGTVTSVKVGSTSYSPSSGVVSLPAYPTTLPASDVSAWAKAATKPSYTLDEVSDGSTRKLANYVLKAGDTMSGDLIIEKTGGGLTIRGERLNSNANGGYIYLAGRYYDNDRNGVKIAAEYPGSVGYDVQDLVIYTSYNRSGNASPVWQEAMRIAARGQTFINGQYTYSLYIDNIASGATSAGIRFRTEGTVVGGVFVNTSNDLYFSAGSSSSGVKILTASNYDSYALPLSAGSSYPLTGNLFLNEGLGIQAAGGTGLFVYHPTSSWSGIDSTQWGLGPINSQGVIRSNDNDLLHYKGGSSYSIWDASNSGISTKPWACSTLSVNTSLTLPNDVSILGTLTDSTTASMIKMSTSNNVVIGNYSFAHNVNLYGTLVKFYAGGTTAIGTVSSTGLDVTGTVTASGIGTFDRMVLSNSGAVSHIEFTRAGWNYISTPTNGVIAFNTGGSGSANTSMAVTPDGIRPGTTAVHSCGLPTAYWGSIYGKDLYLGGDTHNTAAGSIIFSEKLDSQRNGFKIAPVHATSANRVNLVFYRSNNGNSPWAANWTTFMTLSYDGKVTIAGSLTTSGDQVISSDATLKTNWKELNYTVKDIANVKIGIFDWKDGHGTSAGSVAQDWKKLIPELVHGNEGNMTLAYGQIALLNTVMLARRSEDHETRIKALEAENAKLKEEIKRLKS